MGGSYNFAPMQDINLGAIASQVLWAAFALAVAFGAIAQRTHFCTMGAVADIVNIGDWSRMRMWGLAIGVAMLGFNTMVALGWVDAGKSIYAGPRADLAVAMRSAACCSASAWCWLRVAAARRWCASAAAT